jgi:hypothetical protein
MEKRNIYCPYRYRTPAIQPQPSLLYSYLLKYPNSQFSERLSGCFLLRVTAWRSSVHDLGKLSTSFFAGSPWLPLTLLIVSSCNFQPCVAFSMFLLIVVVQQVALLHPILEAWIRISVRSRDIVLGSSFSSVIPHEDEIVFHWINDRLLPYLFTYHTFEMSELLTAWKMWKVTAVHSRSTGIPWRVDIHVTG